MDIVEHPMALEHQQNCILHTLYLTVIKASKIVTLYVKQAIIVDILDMIHNIVGVIYIIVA